MGEAHPYFPFPGLFCHRRPTRPLSSIRLLPPFSKGLTGLFIFKDILNGAVYLPQSSMSNDTETNSATLIEGIV